MKTTLLFIRHAETVLAGTFCGSSNPPLNDRGQSQLPTLLTRLTPFQIDAVYSSDLLRAQQTAAPLATARNLSVHLTPALREIDFGQWESLTWPQIEQRNQLFAQRWLAEFPALPAPDGESFSVFRQRILTELTRLRTLAATQNLAIVTHAGVLRILLEDLCQLPAAQAWTLTRDHTAILPCTQVSPTSRLEFHS